MFRPGMWVGAGRWPNSAAHPDQWGKLLGGQVVAADSPAAWAYTPEFPVPNPDGAQVMNHIAAMRKEGKLLDAIPVLWDHDGYRVMRWERASSLRPYADDLHLYRAKKLMRLDELSHPRREKKRPLASFLPEPLKHLAPQEA